MPRALLATAAAALLAACSGSAGSNGSTAASPDPQVSRLADCTSTSDQLVADAQRYLDAVDASSAAPSPSTSTSATTPAASATSTAGAGDAAAEQQRFSSAISDLKAYAASRGCDAARFREDVVAGLRGLRTGGPVARAVLLQLQAGSSGLAPSTSLRPGDDLAAAVAGAGQGTVLTLAAGDYPLADTLVVLSGVTLRGPGARVHSSAAGGVVLVLTGDAVSIDGLVLVHDGEAAGSVVSAAPAAQLTLTGVTVSGARAAPDGTGGAGLLMASGQDGQTGPQRRTSVTVQHSRFTGNAVAGIVVTGEHRAELSGVTVEDSGQCGVCFLGTSDGALHDSTLTGNAAGVVVGGQARPAITSVTVTGGEVGVQVGDSAAPQVQGVTVTGSSKAAVLYAGTAGGSLKGVTCTGTPFGVVLGSTVVPTVGDNACTYARGQ